VSYGYATPAVAGRNLANTLANAACVQYNVAVGEGRHEEAVILARNAMKDYFYKEVTERARRGARLKTPRGERPRTARVELDHTKMERIRQKWDKGGFGKDFTDVLGPLAGLVRKNIGRPFAKFYSEVKQHLPGNTLATQHILGHLWQMLIKPELVHIGEDGKAYHKNHWKMYRPGGGAERIEYSGWWSDIAYVDPRDGIIKAAPRWKQPKRTKRQPRIRLVDGHYYAQTAGIWYELITEPFTPTYHTEIKLLKRPLYIKVPDRVFDCYFGKELTPDAAKDHYGAYVRCIKTQQIGKRAIKKLGLVA